jgi:photosystem II stability/assembly factor-like uncharacterized protein
MKSIQTILFVWLAWCCRILAGENLSMAFELDFKVSVIEPQSRIDAIAYFGEGIVVAGSRGLKGSGHIYISQDRGMTWTTAGDVTGDDYITCLCSAGQGTGYLLTGRDVHVWRTRDYGKSWIDLGRISHAKSNARFANAYGIVVTAKGTVLVADGDGDGGHIHRSTDQGDSWRDIGRISSKPLYRLNHTNEGIIVNGWAGQVYQSVDDGLSWQEVGHLSSNPLYAIECVGDQAVLVGSDQGHVYRSTDHCQSWKDVGKVGDATDDFAWVGGNRVILSTYNGSRAIYLSEDAGESWSSVGAITTKRNDWLDHVIAFEEEEAWHVVGGTNQGFLVHARLALP